MSAYKTAWFSMGIVSMVVLAAYAAAITNGYVWDDRFFLTSYVLVEDIPRALSIAFEPLFGQRSYVRPIPLFMIYVEAIATRRDPALSHAINLLLHLACSGLVLALARRAARQIWRVEARATWLLPLLIAVMFAVHPALSEAVIWISSRFDLMATLFMLLAVWIYGSALAAWPKSILVALSFFLGALCKESVVVLPIVLVCYQLILSARAEGRDYFRFSDAFTASAVKCYGLIIIAGVAYLIIRGLVLSGAEVMESKDFGFDEHVVRAGLSLWKYVQLTFMPFIGNSPHHSFSWGGMWAMYWPELAFSALVLALVLVLLVKRHVAALVLVAWLASYLPILHIIPLQVGENLVHQRFMYFPTAILFALSPYVLKSVRLSKAGHYFAFSLVCAFGITSVLVVRSIVPVWRSDLALWEWTVRADPRSAEARENLIWAYVDQGMLNEAEAQLALMGKERMKVSSSTAINMGTAYYRAGDYARALENYEIALAQRSKMPPVHRSGLYSNLAVAHAMAGNDIEARGFIGLALAEKDVSINAIGDYLAFCKGKSNRLGEFAESDIRNSAGTIRGVTRLLLKNQPGKYESGDYCPEVKGLPVPQATEGTVGS